MTLDPKYVIKSDEEQFILAEVYLPDGHLDGLLDTDQEFMGPLAVRNTAHDFLMSGRVNKIDVGHSREESGCLVCESFIARKDDPDGFAEGAWVLGIRVLNSDVWGQVKKGDLNGLSWSGPAIVVPVTKDIASPISMKGDTEPHPIIGNPEYAHKHDMEIFFSSDHKVVPGKTATSQGHFHFVEKTTATTEAAGHSHRIIIDRGKH